MLLERAHLEGVAAARRFAELGFSLVATPGTAAALEAAGLAVAEVVGKVSEGSTSTAVDLLGGGKIDLVVNTPRGRGPRADGDYIRSAAAHHGVPCLTTVAAALAAANGMADWAARPLSVRSLQEFHATEQLGLDL